jgi:hypothetical protein
MLENFTLASLEKTKLQPLFLNSLNQVLFSLIHESDIDGNRSISIDLTFKPKDGYVITSMECSHKVPGRSASAIATLDGEMLKIDTVSGDARQLDMFDETKPLPAGE